MSSELRSALEKSLGDGVQLGRELLGGGMAKVFVAEDLTLKRQIVVKVLSPEYGGSIDLERFQREIQVAARLHHPNIVPVLTAGAAGSVRYFTMPYIEGEPLREVIAREKQLSVERAVALTRDVAAALEYAHAQNIVHRDIKPDNILVDGKSGRAVVTDFGIARAIESAADIVSVTSTGLTVGTPVYMSPEQAGADKHIDGRSDIYSLGCVLYEMLAGLPPFTGTSARAVIARHLTEPPPPIQVVRPDLPVALQSTINKMLEKSPAARFANATELLDSLDAVARGSVSAPAVRTPRYRAIAAVAAVAVIAGALWVSASSTGGGGSAASTAALGASPASIAVMYVDAPAADAELSAIARGLTRDLIDALARVPELRLISEAGIRKFRAQAPQDSIARALGVGTIVLGSIERVADSLQLDLRLVDAPSLVQKPALRLKYPMSMLLNMRDTVTREVARLLLKSLSRDVQSRAWLAETKSMRAWQLRNAARDLAERAEDLPSRPQDFGPQLHLLASAESLLVQAAAADPTWEDPVVEQGWARLERARFSTDGLPEQTARLDSAMSTTRDDQARWPRTPRGLELRGAVLNDRWTNSPGATAALADSAEADLRDATLGDPHLARAWRVLGLVLLRRGDGAGSAQATRRAIEADGFERDAGRTYMTLFLGYLYDRKNDSASVLCTRVRSRFPAEPYVQSCELTLLGWTGSSRADVPAVWSALDHTERSGSFSLVRGIFPSGRYWAAAVLGRAGMIDSARAVLARTRAHLVAAGDAGEAELNRAQVLTILGDRDLAIAVLDSVVRRDPARRSSIRALPWFDPLRSIAGFQALVRSP